MMYFNRQKSSLSCTIVYVRPRLRVYRLAVSTGRDRSADLVLRSAIALKKDTVENTNCRARKWLSREVNPLSITEGDLVEICNRLNSTPRKCLGYKTPAEVFRQKVLAQIRRAGIFGSA